MSLQGVQGVKQEPYSVIGTGRTVVSGNNTATQLSSSDTPCKGVYISADPSGGEIITIGDANVGSGAGSWRGVTLYPGHPGVFLPVDNLTKAYFCGATGAIACFTYYV